MKKVIYITFGFLLILLLAVPNNVHAGGKKVKGIQTQQEALARLKYLESRLDSFPEESVLELNKIIKLGIENEWDNSLRQAYILTGRGYKLLNQPQLALYYLEEAKKLYGSSYGYLSEDRIQEQNSSRTKESKPEKRMSSSAYNQKGNTSNLPTEYYKEMAEVYLMQQNYLKSNQYYRELRNRVALSSQRIEIDYAIANNLFQAGDYEAAHKSYNVLLQTEIQFDNQERIEFCNSRIAACIISQGETEKGISYYNNTIIQADKEPQLKQTSSEDAEQETSVSFKSNLEEVSEALRKQKQYKADADFRSDNYRLSDISAKGVEHLKIAQSYYGAGEYDNCETSLDQFLSDGDYNLLDITELDVLKEMASYLENKRRFQKSLSYYKSYNTIRDSVEGKLDVIEEKTATLGEEALRNIIEMEKLQKEKEVSKQTIDYLMRESKLQDEVLTTQRYLIYLLCGVILIGIIAVIYILRVSKQRRIANQQLAVRSLRSQMNPHFIFNALNSVNAFISVSNERDANRFLTEFSTLMRTVMENSEADFIPLSKELEIIRIYLELEHFRFKDKFSYRLIIDDELDEDQYEVPPMLLQPYIENAIWHGLRYKEDHGELLVEVKALNEEVEIVIQDDGIGRSASKAMKTKNQKKFKSTALKNIQARIKIFEDLYGLKVAVESSDLNSDGSGTVVKIKIPQRVNG